MHMPMRVTEKPRFGPKRYLGWGWTPVSWEGWTAIGAFILLLLPTVIVLQGVEKVIAVIVLCGALLGVCILTGDPPG
ncbi:MAG TPA: hypothetical protein VFP34_11475 [Microlunatus sp.]|nr:hypothetical protein [Microlunatus sp.]